MASFLIFFHLPSLSKPCWPYIRHMGFSDTVVVFSVLMIQLFDDFFSPSNDNEVTDTGT